VTTIAEFMVGLGFAVDTKPLDAATDKAKDAADKTSTAWARASDKIGAGLKKIGIGLTALAAGAAVSLGILIAKTSESVKELDQWTIRLGESAQGLQRLQASATKSKVEIDALREGSKTLRENLGEMARVGGGPAVEALGSLGIAFGDIKDLKLEDQLGLVGDALLGVRDPAQRLSVAIQLMGDDGGKLLPVLLKGSRGIREMGDEAQRSGRLMSDDLIAKTRELDARMVEVRGKIEAASLVLLESLMPTIVEVADGMGEWVEENDHLIKQDMPELLGNLASAGRVLANVFGSIAVAINDSVSAFGELQLEFADDEGVLGDIDAWMLGLQGKERGPSGGAVPIGQGRSRAQGRRNPAEIVAEEAPMRPGVESALAQATATSMRAQAMAAGGRAIADRDRRNRGAGFNSAARSKPGGGGGGGASFSADLSAFDIDADERFGAELAMLAERYGAGSVAVDEATKAAGSSLERGDIESEARKAALSRLGSSVGQDLNKKAGSGDPLLSAIFGEDVPDMKLSQMAMGAEPQVLIATINNTFTFDNDFAISGAGNPGDVGSSVAAALREAFQGAIAASTVTAKVNFAR